MNLRKNQAILNDCHFFLLHINICQDVVIEQKYYVIKMMAKETFFRNTSWCV